LLGSPGAVPDDSVRYVLGEMLLVCDVQGPGGWDVVSGESQCWGVVLSLAVPGLAMDGGGPWFLVPGTW
jgi:hypothetical protein